MNGLFCERLGKLRVSLFTFVFIGAVLYSDCSFFTFEVLLAAMLHEFGHLLSMKLFGVKIHSLTVLPYGAVISSDVSLLPYKKEAVVALSGVIINVTISVVSIVIWLFTRDIYTLFFCVCNGFLAIINLVPVPTFDGARAIESMLCEYFTEEKTQLYMENVYYFSFLVLVLLSLYVLNVTEGNFSLVILLAYMFICIYANCHSESE